MSVEHPTGPDGSNADVVAALRAMADFLSEHPEYSVAERAADHYEALAREAAAERAPVSA